MNKERYNVKCETCGEEFQIGRSLAHELGMYEHGFCKCPKCSTYHNVEWHPDTDCMTMKIFVPEEHERIAYENLKKKREEQPNE